MTTFRSALAVGLTAVVIASACSDETRQSGVNDGLGDPGNCIVVDMAVSPEKLTVLQDLAKDFNATKAKVNGTCVFARPARKASGGAAQLLVDGWPNPETNGPQPVIWSPAASGWGGIVNQRTGTNMAANGTPFMLTPLVIAMPKPMADALGYPATPLGFADIVALANDPEGWGRYGHPEWGAFKLGKTNPNFSTSGLNFTIAEYYAATGKTENLSLEDLRRPDAVEFTSNVEQSVVHYGDTTLTFLNNWYRADQRGSALSYVSAVAVEEKSVIDYNMGNPDGILDPGETPRPPRDPLVAIYPKEGTLFSDSPFFILNADWVTDDQRAGAQLFEDFVQQPQNQQKVLQYGFRPNNASVAIGEPLTAANGVDPSQPQSELEVPDPRVLVGVLDAWQEQRKDARVLLVLDVSGSMGDTVTDDGTTKLDLAKQAAVNSLDKFKETDEVGLWIFSTNLASPSGTYIEAVPVGPMSQNRETLRSQIQQQGPIEGTPLYDVTSDAFTAARDAYDPAKINAVVILTDGHNDDGTIDDDQQQYDDMIRTLGSGSEGTNSKSVRVFTIGYGADADSATLRSMAEATNAAYYSASDPATIDQVFTNVVSNF